LTVSKPNSLNPHEKWDFVNSLNKFRMEEKNQFDEKLEFPSYICKPSSYVILNLNVVWYFTHLDQTHNKNNKACSCSLCLSEAKWLWRLLEFILYYLPHIQYFKWRNDLEQNFMDELGLG